MAVYKMPAPREELDAAPTNKGAQFRVYTTTNGQTNNIPFESQILSVGGGFLIFVVIVAFLATVHRRKLAKRGSREFHSPLIPQQIAPLKNSEKSKFLKQLKSVKDFPRLCGVNMKPYTITSSQSGYENSTPRLSLPNTQPNTVNGSTLSSPSGTNSSGGSPQCTPLNPYQSFGTVVQTPNSRRGSNKSLPEHRGSISLQLQYDALNTTLQVTIFSCHDLPELMIDDQPHQQSQLNPYVKLRILPDNQHRVKTRVLKKTRNPMYDETFTLYGITEASIQNYTFDRYSRDIIIGEALYKLGSEPELTTNSHQKLNVSLNLKARQSFGEQRGQILISMAHNSQSQSLNFAVLKVKDLPMDQAIGLIVYMLLNGQKIAKQKTHVKYKCHDAVFNESFSFKLISTNNNEVNMDLESISFQVLVLNHDGVTRNEVIGQCNIDLNSIQLAQVWAAPGKQISEWYTIQQP